MEALVNRIWYQNHWAKWLLWPLSWLFALISAVRRQLFRHGIKPVEQLPVPVLLVGNITVGGSGKTPMVIYLVELLRQHGYHPGVISRGYGSQQLHPRLVKVGSSASDVGDEPAMIVQRTQVPMAVGQDRIATAKLLLAEHQVDIIISDDGLQHYRLGRDIELVVIDGQRQLGNGMLLPAGPLREGAWRLESVDFVVENGAQQDSAQRFAMQLQAAKPQPLHGQVELTATQVKAVAGIGNPQRFFDTLQQLGYDVAQTQCFADHHPYSAADFSDAAAGLPIIMTEKDAIKCRTFTAANCWYLPVDAKLSATFSAQLLAKVAEAVAQKQIAKN
ncbi:tetraacyldisaccharide 4'-kinase [Shewanella sp. C32]|uniref:Tetraacyldisaccharide 4'-kinase n=1 Tax=Shewanella electrica TaxID=515560 RepID=A0ABT2FLB5_9GAMM|nr:tetraacyldisaccharide 4'-kinase [Shewanella electrica]MCH1924777.1 tetraacyldisaccharide 4'-kinase [Shewanella electrica]MCS4556776.1 tetraacyldisaccharide 4'-kinase [Shewanella electrica]